MHCCFSAHTRQVRVNFRLPFLDSREHSQDGHRPTFNRSAIYSAISRGRTLFPPKTSTSQGPHVGAVLVRCTHDTVGPHVYRSLRCHGCPDTNHLAAGPPIRTQLILKVLRLSHIAQLFHDLRSEGGEGRVPTEEPLETGIVGHLVPHHKAQRTLIDRRFLGLKTLSRTLKNQVCGGNRWTPMTSMRY